MGGIALTVITKDKPEQSLFEDYVILHQEMYLEGCLAKDPSKEYRESDVELGRKEFVGEEPPLEIHGPYKIFENGDMLPEVAALVQAPCWQLKVYCAVSSELSWGLAEDIARRVAQKYRGVVYSPGMGVEWPETKRVPRVEERYFDLLRLEWFVHSSKAPAQPAQVFLDTLKDFPEARPVRFGTFKPLQGQLEPEDDRPFLDAWRDCGGETLIFKSRSPCIGGCIEFQEDPTTITEHLLMSPKRAAKGVVQLRLQFEEQALTQEQREKVIGLFIKLAKRLGCFYARGYLNRSYYLYGGDLRSGPSEIRTPSALIRYGWQGIPPYTVWLSWFGRPYKGLVMNSVKHLAPMIIEEGVFIRLGDKPLDMHELEAKFKFDLPKELLEGWAKRDSSKEAALEKKDMGIPPASRGWKADLIPKLDD